MGVGTGVGVAVGVGVGVGVGTGVAGAGVGVGVDFGACLDGSHPVVRRLMATVAAKVRRAREPGVREMLYAFMGWPD